MIDSHTHSAHSQDGREPARVMIEAAIAKGLKYIALTDHLDREYPYLMPQYREIKQLDLDAHIEETLALKSEYSDRIIVGLGAEGGYYAPANGEYIRDIGKLSICGADVVINSVHTVGGEDVYMPQYYEGKSRPKVMRDYLEAVYESLDAPYRYEIVGHIGYIARKAPYPDNDLEYSDFPELFDAILEKMITMEKALEVNAHNKGTHYPFLPAPSVVARYRELGGKLISYGSDAHWSERIGDKYDIVTDFLKDIGIVELVYYVGGKPRFERI